MTSSNGESTSKIARFDDVMVASLKEELEKEKEVIKSTLKKREEVATKRRQVVRGRILWEFLCGSLIQSGVASGLLVGVELVCFVCCKFLNVRLWRALVRAENALNFLTPVNQRICNSAFVIRSGVFRLSSTLRFNDSPPPKTPRYNVSSSR